MLASELTHEMSVALEHPDKVTVYSLDPFKKVRKGGYFSYTVLGSTSVSDQKRKQQIGAALKAETGFGTISLCAFVPHHGVTVESKGKKLDYVICFHCRAIHLYRDGSLWSRANIQTRTITTKGPWMKRAPSLVESLLNQSLKDAQVPLCDDYKAGLLRSRQAH